VELPIYWIDAFTERVFGGNPAAVIELPAWIDDALLQRIAFENGLSETAYFVRSGPGRADLRWFTPAVEVDLCGHATLATAHVLFDVHGHAGPSFIFDSKSGPLTVTRRGPLTELDFPARPAERAQAPDDLLRGLGAPPAEVLLAKTMWLCVYGTESEVRALRPDFDILGRVAPGRIIATAPGDSCDFVSRFFAPDAGIAEDPVTGSAHCTLTPYWSLRLGRSSLHARQVSRRGGELWCQVAGDRIRIAGRSVLYLRGTVIV
jgi:predicted PhzF superfamily epimerase YddE/YHI9